MGSAREKAGDSGEWESPSFIPAPVFQTFFMDEDVQAQTQLDAVVTVVDAVHVNQHWDAEEVQEQIAFADVLLLSR